MYLPAIMRALAGLSILCLLPLACGEDTVGPPASADTESGSDDDEGGGTTSEPQGTDAADGSDSAGGGESSTGEPEEIPPPLATGLQIVEVTLDQGIRVPIARNGELVGPTDRNQPILQGRPGVFRAFYETDPDYATRAIYGILYIEQPDGTTTQYENFMMTSPPECEPGQYLYDCRYGQSTGSFLWRVEEEDVNPNIRYRIELYETAPGHENDPSDKIPLFPADGGTMIVGVENTYMKMRVVVVPLYHDNGADCPEAPDLLEEFGTDIHNRPRTVADYLRDNLFAANPADEVEIIVHETIDFDGDMTGGAPLFLLQQLRSQEDADPGLYYYAVGRPCGQGPDFSGLAQLGGPTPGEASQRVGWGVFHQNNSSTANTFVHEIGHEQGRSHIACLNPPEPAAGPDTSYPDHPEGHTLSWGVDMMSNPIAIQSPSNFDYMSYCGPSWVSEWGWSKVLPWITEISSWERSAAAPAPGLSLVGMIAADGSSQFFVSDGQFTAERTQPDQRVRLRAGGEVLDDVAAFVAPYGDSDDLNVVVPLTDATWIAAESVELEVAGRSLTIDPRTVPVYGRAATRLR